MKNWFAQLWSSSSRRPARRSRQLTLRLEELEKRLVPATITVNTTLDILTPITGSPAVSLREAITSINQGADDGDGVAGNRTGVYGVNDTINFAITGAGVQKIIIGGNGACRRSSSL